MKVVDTARKIAEGATVAVILVTALPVAGPVGVITVTGAKVAAICGATCAAYDCCKNSS